VIIHLRDMCDIAHNKHCGMYVLLSFQNIPGTGHVLELKEIRLNIR